MIGFTFSRFNVQGLLTIICKFSCCRKHTMSRGDSPSEINRFLSSGMFRGDFCYNDNVVYRPDNIAQLQWILHFPGSMFNGFARFIANSFVVASNSCHVEIPHRRSIDFLVLRCSEGIFAATVMLVVGQATWRNYWGLFIFQLQFPRDSDNFLQFDLLPQANHVTWRFPTGDQYIS